MTASASNGAGTTWRIRFGGVGGQGIVLAGRLLGQAAALHDGKEAVCTQTYGPEARGGASRTDVIVSDDPVDYPFVIEADVLAVLFQEAYAKYRDCLAPEGLMIIDTGLVNADNSDENVCGLPATEIAEKLGNRVVTNVVILGYLVEKTGVVSRDAIEAAIRATVKPKVIDLDMRALEAGARAARGEDPL